MVNFNEVLLKQSKSLILKDFQKGKVCWESPSNIAIVKYWGKKDIQIPLNPSISFSLDKSKTKTIIEFETKKNRTNLPSINFQFEGKENKNFQSRIESFLKLISPYFPFLENLDLNIQTENTFPHSAGIASSASSLSSIALCLCSIENKIFDTLHDSNNFYKKASFISRLGSGSAARSVFPQWSIWGENNTINFSSDEFAMPLTDIHKEFQEINDSVLLVSSAKKTISSSQGHNMMNGNPFSLSRIKQANKNCIELYSILKSGDLDNFIDIAENEALTLHALMMSSTPGYLLLHPNSLILIDKIRSFRKETKIPVGFTIDAGPNIHLLSFSKDKDQIDDFVCNELSVYCEDKKWIDDNVGNGAKEILMMNK